jgi:hypothetical protein
LLHRLVSRLLNSVTHSLWIEPAPDLEAAPHARSGAGRAQKIDVRHIIPRLHPGPVAAMTEIAFPSEPSVSRETAPGSRLPAPGSRLPAPGSRLPAPGSRLPAPGSRLPAPRIVGRGWFHVKRRTRPALPVSRRSGPYKRSGAAPSRPANHRFAEAPPSRGIESHRLRVSRETAAVECVPPTGTAPRPARR